MLSGYNLILIVSLHICALHILGKYISTALWSCNVVLILNIAFLPLYHNTYIQPNLVYSVISILVNYAFGFLEESFFSIYIPPVSQVAILVKLSTLWTKFLSRNDCKIVFISSNSFSNFYDVKKSLKQYNYIKSITLCEEKNYWRTITTNSK